jgi:hypothetical protein
VVKTSASDRATDPDKKEAPGKQPGAKSREISRRKHAGWYRESR